MCEYHAVKSNVYNGRYRNVFGNIVLPSSSCFPPPFFSELSCSLTPSFLWFVPLAVSNVGLDDFCSFGFFFMSCCRRHAVYLIPGVDCLKTRWRKNNKITAAGIAGNKDQTQREFRFVCDPSSSDLLSVLKILIQRFTISDRLWNYLNIDRHWVMWFRRRVCTGRRFPRNFTEKIMHRFRSNCRQFVSQYSIVQYRDYPEGDRATFLLLLIERAH